MEQVESAGQEGVVVKFNEDYYEVYEKNSAGQLVPLKLSDSNLNNLLGRISSLCRYNPNRVFEVRKIGVKEILSVSYGLKVE